MNEVRFFMFFWNLVFWGLFSVQSFASLQGDVRHLDFDREMGSAGNEQFVLLFQNDGDAQRLGKFRQLYVNASKRDWGKLGSASIPKIIHQIWLGPLEIPQKSLAYRKSWQKIHPNWQYRLWTDEDVANWDFPNKDLFEKASSYQEKADILRYEILRKFGGIYADIDYIAFRNFTDLAENFEFFASLEPDQLDFGVTISNAIIGSRPGHPVFDALFKKIRSHWDEIEQEYATGEISGHVVKLAIKRSMRPLTQAIDESLSTNDRAILLPPTYLMPIFPSQEESAWQKTKAWFDRLRNPHSNLVMFREIKPHSMASQNLRAYYKTRVDLQGLKKKSFLRKLYIKFKDLLFQ